MMNLKKSVALLAFVMLVSSAFGLSASAARAQGSIGNTENPSAAYDYTLRNPLLPWDCVKGYSNTSFVVSQSTINSGFTAYSYIYAVSNDGKEDASKTAYVQKGTNYAHTGDIALNGYTKDCHSTHKSVYSAGGINFSKNLNSTLF